MSLVRHSVTVKISLTELLWYNDAVLAFSTTTPCRRGGGRPNPTNPSPWIRRCPLRVLLLLSTYSCRIFCHTLTGRPCVQTRCTLTVSAFQQCKNFQNRLSRGTTTAEKLTGTKVWIPTPGRLRPAPGQRPAWVLSAGGGGPRPLWGSGGIIPPLKIFENSDAKSCILVTFCEISCFLKTTAKKLGNQYIVGPQHKSWGTSLPRSLRLLRLCV